MGSEQSAEPPAGAPGSSLKSQRDEDIPYTSFSISKPIDGGKYNRCLTYIWLVSAIYSINSTCNLEEMELSIQFVKCLSKVLRC